MPEFTCLRPSDSPGRTERGTDPGILPAEKEKKRVFTEPMDEVEWGRIPDEYHTSKFMDYPKSFQLIAGTVLPPDQIRSLIEAEMKKEKGRHNMTTIEQLRSYALLFPDSKWLTASERAWLDQPYETFFYKLTHEMLE